MTNGSPESDQFNDLTRRLGENYDRWKEYERAKNRDRDEFFAAINEELKNEVPPQTIVEISAENEEAALRQAERQYVRHRVLSTKPIEGGFQIVLEENHEYRPYSIINKSDGRVYQRIVVEGSPSLDDDSIREEKPELWEAISEEVTERRLKPLDKLTPEQLDQLQPYLMLPKPQVKLGAPRKAKDEELDNDDS